MATKRRPNNTNSQKKLKPAKESNKDSKGSEAKKDKEFAGKPEKTKGKTGNGVRRFVAVVLWAFIVVAIIGTVFLIATYSGTKTLLSDTTAVKDSLAIENEMETEASSFAEAFVKEWYTFNAEKGTDDYNARVGQYLAKGFTMEAAQCTGSMDVITVNTRFVDIIDEDSVDVTVYAKVSFAGKIETEITREDGAQTTEQRDSSMVRDLLIKVPVDYKDGHLAVIDNPMLTADGNVGTRVAAPKDVNGDTITDGEEKRLREVTTNFLNAYYGNEASELAYFVTKDYGTAVPLGGVVELVNIEDMQVLDKQSHYDVQVTYKVTNGITTQTQRIYLQIEGGADNRLYINKMSTRMF